MYFVHIADMGFFEPNCIKLCLKILNYQTVCDKKLPWELDQKSDHRKLPGQDSFRLEDVIPGDWPLPCQGSVHRCGESELDHKTLLPPGRSPDRSPV